MLLDFFLGLVDPVQAVEAERDDEHENYEADAALLPKRAGVSAAVRAHEPPSVGRGD
jgi:hypothetical protein